MNNNYINVQVKSKLENVFAVRMCISSFLSNANICYDELMDIKTAVSEAVTNSIEHAYDDNLEQDNYIVSIACELNENIVKIIVEDYGKGIEDISLAMTPAYTTKPESEHVGMGFTIINSFMNEVIVQSKVDKGTKITMLKKLNKNKD